MKKSVLLIFLSILFLISCSNQNLDNFDKGKIGKALRDQGIIVNEVEDKNYIKVDSQKPSIYNYRGNKFLLYIFLSENKRVTSIKKFLDLKKEKNIVVPQIFEKKNIAILYYTNEDRTDPYLNRNKELLDFINKL